MISAFYSVYTALGYGFTEAVYAAALDLEITARGLRVVRRAAAEVRYKGHVVGRFHADLLVESRLVVELEASRRLDAARPAQVVNYLHVAGLEVGLLLHFGPRPALYRFIPAGRQGGSGKRRAADAPLSATLQLAGDGAPRRFQADSTASIRAAIRSTPGSTASSSTG